MEKNRIRPVHVGKGVRMSYSKQKEVLEMPNLIEVQTDSYKWFLEEGLNEVLRDISPIADYNGNLSLEFVSFELCRDDVKYSIEECKERDATYAAPLKVKVRLHNNETEEISEHDIFMGDLPLMTDTGTFVINGAERVIVTQLHRSPGVFFDDTLHPNGTRIYTARIIPFRGSWVEFITDIHDVIYAYIDRKKKFPVTTLLRALGFSSDEQIMNLFELSEDIESDQLNDELLGRRIASDIVDLQTGEIIATRDMIMTEELLLLLQSTEISPLKVFSYKDASDEPLIAKTLTKDLTRNREDALEAIYKQLRSTDAPDLETAEALIEKLFFNPKRYDLGVVGRFRINQKLKLNIDAETTTLTIEDFVAILKHYHQSQLKQEPYYINLLFQQLSKQFHQ